MQCTFFSDKKHQCQFHCTCRQVLDKLQYACDSHFYIMCLPMLTLQLITRWQVPTQVPPSCVVLLLRNLHYRNLMQVTFKTSKFYRNYINPDHFSTFLPIPLIKYIRYYLQGYTFILYVLIKDHISCQSYTGHHQSMSWNEWLIKILNWKKNLQQYHGSYPSYAVRKTLEYLQTPSNQNALSRTKCVIHVVRAAEYHQNM